MEVKLEVAKGISQVKKAFNSEKAEKRSLPILRKSMKEWLVLVAAQASTNAVTMFASHPSGQLAKSIKSLMRRKALAGEIFSRLEYAGVQEEGTKTPIRPVNAKWLTQPLPGAKTRSGRLKMSARKFFEKYKNTPRKSVFVGKSKKGNLLIFLSKYKGRGKTDLTPLFLLRKQTTIEGKFFIRKAIETSPGFDQYLGDKFIRALTS